MLGFGETVAKTVLMVFGHFNTCNEGPLTSIVITFIRVEAESSSELE